MTDSSARAYLLGQLTEAEAARLDARVLEEDDFFLSIRSAEDDLFDDYVRGRLTAIERTAFVERFGHDLDRIAFARALADRASSSRPGRILIFPRRYLMPLAAAATVIVGIGALFLLRFGPNAGPSLVGGASPRATAAPPTPPIVVALTLGTSRSVRGSHVVTLPQAAATVMLRVRLDAADRFDRYAMELRSSQDTIVWGDAALRATSENHELTLSAIVPSSRLPNGVYELGVRGAQGTSTPEDLGFVSLEVRRSP